MTKLTRWNSFWPLLALAACSDVVGTGPAPEPALDIQVSALTATTSIQRGKFGSVVDATISAQHIQKNYGDDARLVVSKRNEVLMRFDLGGIPANAVINSATLTLYLHGHDQGDDDDDCDDDRDDDRRGFAAIPIDIRLATSPWLERKVTYRSFDQDFEPGVIGILVPAGKNTYKSLDLKSTVQHWVGATKPNFGVVLVTRSKKRWAFASSENSRVALRPMLTVSYSTPDDHCASDPCANGGACTNTWTGFTCQCTPGWSGATCETNIDDCSGSPCLNGGTCVDGLGSYTCSCVAGFGGAQCQTNINDCEPNPCEHGGVCSDGVDAFTCACALGYSGPTCGSIVDNCADGPCQNGGGCSNGVGTYTCHCPVGFSGVNCEVNVDDCAGSPCQNGGVCTDGVNAYACNCAAGFTGPDCETNIDDCASAPCQNGGGCVDGITSYVCECSAGFSGANCEVNLDDCASHPCVNGVCVDGDASYTCACQAGYGGTRCEVDLDDCAPNPCQNGGACNDGVNSYSCDCAQGYEGPKCESVCTGGDAASVVADLGDVTAPAGYEYRTPTDATASSPNECPAWSCGEGLGPAQYAIDDIRSTGWNSGTWDFGGGFDLTLTFTAPRSFNGLHTTSQLWPTDDITFTVTLMDVDGVATTLAPRTATIFDTRPNPTQTGVDIGFSPAGYHRIVRVVVHMSAPYEGSNLSTWLDVRELQLIVPAGCEPPATCPTGSSSFGGSCYQAFTQLPPSPNAPFNYWLWADNDCASRFPGGRLASVHGEAENAFIRSLVDPNRGIMLGASDSSGPVNTFAWLDGSAFTYSAWGVGEPNNRGVNRFGFFLTEDWLTLGQDGRWNDLPYTDGNPYVCKFAP